jgi:hypothetical protein
VKQQLLADCAWPDMTSEFDQVILTTLEAQRQGPETFDATLDQCISIDEVAKALKQLKPRKAAGVDKIIPELLIHGQDILLPYLRDIFQYIFEKGVYPDSWAEGILQLIHKKGDINDPGNYRDLTLLSCMGKVFDNVLYNRLKICDIDIHESQSGFRKGYSTADNIFVLQSLVTKSFMERKTLYCAFIDLKRAFNSVYRQGLWYKLISEGYCGRLISIVRNMYEKIKCRIRLHGGKLSDVFVTLMGLQQGAILSPFLFAFFLNDLPDILNARNPHGGISVGNTNIILLMYADDMVAVSNTVEGLQTSLDIMHEYFSKWKLTVNLQKSNVLVCKSRAVLRPNEKWTYDGQILDTCTSYNYLGINFTTKGINNASLDILVNQAKKALASLQTSMANIGTFPPAVSLRMFHTCIMPILCYGAEVWGYLNGNKMQCVLNRWCKRILGVKLTTCNAAVAGELGQYPLCIFRKIMILKYWIKVISGSHNRIRYIMYLFLKQHVNIAVPGCKNWANEVRNILIEIGNEGSWHNNDPGMEHGQFIARARCTLIDLYIMEWKRELESKEKMSTYILYKTGFGHELYLSYIKSTKYRMSLTRLRLSSHCLNIEVGRYHPRIPRHMRYCTQCELRDLEDEYHFILKCPKYRQLRNIYIPRYYSVNPSMAKYVQLMADLQNNLIISCNVSKYITEANKLKE